jgi:hypothetical protein
MIDIGVSDWLILGMWFLVVSSVIFIKNSVWNNPFSKFLFPAFLLKVLGGFAFVMVYHYYYQGGDTSYYFMGSNTLSDILFESPSHYFRLLFSSTTEAEHILKQLNKSIIYVHSEEEWFMVRLISPLTIIGLKSFLGTTFFLSLFSLIGSWKLFKLMNKIIPNREKTIFAISFLIPSVLFWGSGIMKDTITMICFYYIICWFYEMIYERKYSFFRILCMMIFMFIVFKLKAYILLNLFPWIFFTLFLIFLNRRPSLFLKIISLPFLLIVIAITAYFISSFVMESSGEYNSDRFFFNMQGFHDWNTYLGGSAYSLGDMEYTIGGILKKAPAAINVTLFRPYLWEANSTFVLLSALESSIIIFFTIWTLVKTKFKLFRVLLKSPFLTGGLLFCFSFSFAIGLTAYNFGALARFKIPLLGLYLFILLYIITNRTNMKASSDS